jgi:hypothetical protein
LLAIELTMSLRYLLIVLIACIGPTRSRVVDRTARFASRPVAAPSRFDSLPARVSSPAPATKASLARPALWRHRIKSMLEEKDILPFELVDRGPAVIPDPSVGAVRLLPSLSRSSPLIPLRC